MSGESMRYFGTLDGGDAVRLLIRWREAHPRLSVVALVPEAWRDRIARIQEVCREARVPVFGAVFPALVVDGRFAPEGIWFLRLDEHVHAALVPELPRQGDLSAAADALVAGMRRHLVGASRLGLLLLFDGMFPRVGSLLDELYLRLANRVHYLGANAGSETFQPMPCLFDGERVAQGGVLAVLLAGSRGAVLEHGYRAPGRMITAISTEGNRIIQIDWRPAFEVYQTMGRLMHGVSIDRENFYRNAVHFPFGIVRASGVPVVRIPVAVEDDGSLFCVGEVPPNSLLTVLAAPAVDSRKTVETIAAGLDALGGAGDERELLLFYCAGRRLYLGVPAAEEEIGGLRARARAARIAGALSLGEIGATREWAYPVFHNAALLAARWGGA
jgi:hypothetical protein